MSAGTVAAVKDDRIADLLRIGADDVWSAESRSKSLAGFIFADDRLGKILIDVLKDFFGSLA